MSLTYADAGIYVEGPVTDLSTTTGKTDQGEAYIRNTVYIATGRDTLRVRWNSEKLPLVGSYVRVRCTPRAWIRPGGSPDVAYSEISSEVLQ